MIRNSGFGIFIRLVILLFVSLSKPLTSVAAQGPAQKFYGVNFSPYLTGQNPNMGSQISVEQIRSRMQIVAASTNWVRSFGTTNGLEQIPLVAREFGLKVAAGAWISTSSTQNAIEIQNLIALANAHLIDIAIVGSEAILRNDVTEAQLIAYMNQVRSAIPSDIPVTTADVWGTFITHPNLIAASDKVFVNFYPYWEGTSINNAICSLQQQYQQLINASGSKAVWVSETGWPSAGNTVGAAVASAANENLFALQFFSWAKTNSIPYLFFEAFDEEWKSAYEGPQGAHWGIWDTAGLMKPGMDAFLNGQGAATVECNGQIPGPIGIHPVYVPPYGSSDVLEVQVTGVQPSSYKVATYINPWNGWWSKPTFANPTVAINPDGTARIAIVTGGVDQLATEIAVFLIPSDCTPPQAGGGGLPLPTVSCAVATFRISRTQSSISGKITDDRNQPLPGVTITDPTLGTTSVGSDGKYSFYNITTSGTATLTVTCPNCTFPTSPYTLTIPAGNRIVNFVGVRALAVTPASLSYGYVGVPYAVTLAADGGVKPYDNWAISSGSLPPGMFLNAPTGIISGTPTTTNGSPFLFGVTVKDQQGSTSAPQSLSITVVPGITTSTVLVSSANSSTLGQTVVLTATVTPAPSAGTITFLDGTTLLGIRPLSGGTATLITSMLPSGSRLLKAHYGGGVPFSSSRSIALVHVVRALPASDLHAAATFGASANFSNWIVLGDFNGDRKIDLAVSNSNLYTLSIFIGNDNGSFQSAINTALADYPDSIATGDFNADDKVDLVVVHSNRKLLRILLGKGDGTFQIPLVIDTPVGSSVAISDFNSDGRSDLAIYNANGLTVLVGNGDGTFQISPSVSTGPNASSMAIADLNADGRADVIIGSSNSASNVSALLGNGDGTFQAALNFTAGSYARSVAVGDFNADGKIDLAVANYDSNNLSVLLGDGDGTFQSAVNFATAASPAFVTVGDFNGDGKIDISVISYGNRTVSQLLGNGDGTFQSPISLLSTTNSRSVAVGDFNRDGTTDLAIANGGVLLGTPVPAKKRSQLISD